MQDEKSALLEKAARCRRLMLAISANDVAANLLALAGDYEARAARLPDSSMTLMSSEVPRPPGGAQMDVARRAYFLWERAGHPEGRADEFYFEAERQLRDEA